MPHRCPAFRGGTLAASLLALASTGPATAQTASKCSVEPEVLIERPWAESVGVAVGDTVAVATEAEGSGCRAVVAGLFEPPPDPTRLTIERPRIIFHLPDLAAVLGRPDVVDRFSVRLTGARAAEWTAAELTAKMPGTQVLPTSVVTARASTTFAVIERFHGAIAVITLVAGGVFLACIMFLKVGERRSPVAALRLVGVSRTTLVLWVVAEAALISLAGGALGVGLGALASRIINLHYQAAYDTTLVFSLLDGVTIARALILAVALGLIAGFVAVVDLLRRDALAEAGG